MAIINLCLGVVNFPDNMGITANAVDLQYRSNVELHRILGEFSRSCVEAAERNTSLCQLAVRSLGAPDPVTSVIERINQTILSIAEATYTDPDGRRSFGFLELANTISGSLREPQTFTSLAQYLLDAETAVRKGTTENTKLRAKQITSKRSSANISSSDYNAQDLLSGGVNELAGLAVWCLDVSDVGINTVATFSERVSTLISQDPLIGFQALSAAPCLGWPNLTEYNVERFTGQFPSTLDNKIIVLGITNDPITPYQSAMATYQYIGSDNAVFLVHDAFGHTSFASQNGCTGFWLHAYFVNGREIVKVS
jgi:hypothetical protein